MAGLAAVFVVGLGWFGFSYLQERLAIDRASGLQAALAGGQVDLGQARTSVVMASFWIDLHEVSVEQYQACMAQGHCTAPRLDAQQSVPSLPIVGVTATQAAEFCRWLGRRLPSYAEWERAARGATYRPWPWGTAAPDATRVNALFGVPMEPHFVAVEDPAFIGGATDDHIFHLFGNASEWTNTPIDCPRYACDDPWQSGSTAGVALLVVGLSMTDQFVLDRAYVPIDSVPGLPDERTGFRCARS